MREDYLQQEWDSLTDTCKDALRTAMPGKDTNLATHVRVGALNRAIADQMLLKMAAEQAGIDWKLLGAIGIRESGFKNTLQPNGKGGGIFQIDLGQNPSVTTSQASDAVFAATWAATKLATDMSGLASAYPAFTSMQLLQATAASYNFRTGNISGDPASIDIGTTRNNYGQNVLDLMDCLR